MVVFFECFILDVGVGVNVKLWVKNCYFIGEFVWSFGWGIEGYFEGFENWVFKC